jgi:G3E family GTPase
MKLHIVGGFLGSGKTTAISNGARLLIQKERKVAVVTNDQGKYLVDTSFMDSKDIPTAEVTNGCFCCNFDSLSDQIKLLEDKIQPEYIFAESVGSCTDLVATVLKPLQLLKKELFDEMTFSVFADSRLLLDYLLGKMLHFSDAISYIFEKQIEEADLLIINKIDLLSAEDLITLRNLVEVRLSRKNVIFQNTLNQLHIQHWLSILESLPNRRRDSLEIDYQIYGKGEAEMAWLDEAISIQTDNSSALEHALIFIGMMIDEIEQREISIGHLKFLLKGDGLSHKISFTTINEDDWKIDLPVSNNSNILIMVNLRIEATPELAREIVKHGISAISGSGVTVTVTHEQAFQPGFPNPTHRISRILACCDECRCIKNPDNLQIEKCLCECKLVDESCCSF